MKQLTVIDVGASDGLFANFVASRRSKNGDYIAKVLAIEPVPSSSEKIKHRANLIILRNAVLSPESIPISGKRILNVTKNPELSSFLEVNQKSDTVLWQSHLPNLVISQRISVECVTLEKIMKDHNLEKVDFLKIDTQGSDLSVLRSAGSEISKIMSVVVELPYSKAVQLYDGEEDVLEGIKILAGLGFSPVRLVPNGGGECNVFFLSQKYSIEEYFQMELELGFERAPVLKIGPHNSRINLNLLEKLGVSAEDKVERLAWHIRNLRGPKLRVKR